MIYHFVAEQTEAKLDFNITVSKNKRVYCFIGDNAVGKTQLLENLARTLLYCHSLFSQSSHHNYSGIFVKKEIYQALKDLSLQLAAGNICLNQTSIKEHEPWDWIGFGQLPNQTRSLIIDKPIVFIGAKNRGYTKNIDKNQIKILGNASQRFLEAFFRSFDYMNGKALDGIEVADWFNSRLIINPNFVPEHQKRVFEVEMVLKLMQQLEPGLNLMTEKDGVITDFNIYFDDGQLYIDSVPIDKLSTGLVSIIKLFQEIIAAYSGWTGLMNDNELSQVDGIVFIDEIESHIHPKWQYRIISLLTEFFPKTTFYIATHSPVIVSTTDEGEAYELIRRPNQVTAHPLGNPKQWYLNDVFAQAFHIDFIESTNRTDNDSNLLIQKLKEFSVNVKDYVTTKDEHLKQQAELLYQQILPSLAEQDPRRRSLDSLRMLLG
jgi:energy-coupling factor transporter ATP-binding protein EcfA2